jgi:hypothetical protein
VHKYCRRILFESVLYYREEDTLNVTEEKEHIFKIHFEFLSLIEEQMIYHISTKKEMDLFYEFLEVIIKTCSLTISRKAFHNIEAFDLTLAIQLTQLAKNIASPLKKCSNKEKLLKIIKCIM